MVVQVKSPKLVKAETARISQLLSQQEKILRQQFELFIRRSTTRAVLDRVQVLLTASNIEEVLRIVDTNIEQFSNALGSVFINAAQKEADVWAVRLGRLEKQAHSLNLADPRITQVIARNRQAFIMNFTGQQRDLIRRSLIEGMRLGDTNEKLTQRYRQTVGLTLMQRRAVVTYQRALEATGTKDPLQVIFHDPQFEGIVGKVDEPDELSPSRIQMMINAFVEGLRKARAKIMAATEALRLVGQARDVAVHQVAESVGVNPRAGTKTWLHTSAAEPRETHLQMVGDTVGMDEPFISPTGARLLFPGDTSLGATARDIVNCQCGVEYSFDE
jgi:hypothetical protein